MNKIPEVDNLRLESFANLVERFLISLLSSQQISQAGRARRSTQIELKMAIDSVLRFATVKPIGAGENPYVVAPGF
jgi:hypothetical protein